MSTIGIVRIAPAFAASQGWFTWKSLRIPIAALLAIAAAAKVQDIAKLLAGDGLLSSQPMLLTAIGIEAALAFYLLFGDQLWSWRFVFALFSLFAIVSGYAWATGTDCNCISKRISPAAMFAIDIAVFAAAWWTRPLHLPVWWVGSEERADGESRAGITEVSMVPLSGDSVNLERAVRPNVFHKLKPIFPIALALMTGIATATAANWRHQTIAASEQPNIEYLIPELLVGKRWPLDSRIDPRLKPLETGRWMVVIVRRDCPHCQEFLDKHFADPTWHRPGERTAVFVAGSDQWPFDFDYISSNPVQHRLAPWPDHEPFAESPFTAAISDSIVTFSTAGTVPRSWATRTGYAYPHDRSCQPQKKNPSQVRCNKFLNPNL